MSVQVKCRILMETENAVLIEQLSEGFLPPVGCWIPRSQCDHLSKGPMQPDNTRDAVITIADWLAEKHKLRTQD